MSVGCDPQAAQRFGCSWKRMAALLALGALVGVVNNLLAGPTRHLDWIGHYPDKRVISAETGVEPVALEALQPPDQGGDELGAALPPIVPDQAYVEISRAQVRALHNQGAIFVDARRTSQFEEGHIQGAHSISIWESGVDEKIVDLTFLAGGDEEVPVVVYCNGGDCEDSHMLAEKLWLQDFLHVLVYVDGYPDWLDAGGAIDEGGPS